MRRLSFFDQLGLWALFVRYADARLWERRLSFIVWDTIISVNSEFGLAPGAVASQERDVHSPIYVKLCSSP